jgi:beta-galactosidase
MSNPNSRFISAGSLFLLVSASIAWSADELSRTVAEGGTLAEKQAGYPVAVAEPQGPVGLSGIFIDPVVGQSRADVRIEVKNGMSNSQAVKFDCVLSAGSKQLSQKGGSLNLEPGAVSQAKISFDIKNARLWSPEDPYLYTLTIKLFDDAGSEIDARTHRFGMRSIEIGTDLRLYLNGRPTYLRGNTWVPQCYSLIPFEPAFCHTMMIEQKKQGFNYLRHHSTVPPYPWYYDLADEIGLMIEVETGFDLEASKAVVRSYYNHPSIIIWAGVNEAPFTGVKPEVQAWYKMMKSLDPTRKVYDCSGWGEYDRDTADILNQHMGYEYPYLKNEDMYIARYEMYEWNNSAKGVPWSVAAAAIKAGTFTLDKPEMIHELQGNAQVYSMKTLMLDSRMRAIWEAFRLDYADWPNYVKVCQRFANATYKLQIEAARRGNNKIGFDFLTVADSIPEIIRNDNEKSKWTWKTWDRWPDLGDMDITGTCDNLGDSKPWLVADFPKFNAAHVVLIDTHSKPRTLWAGESIQATVMASCFDYPPPKRVDVVWKLKNGKQAVAHGSMKNVELQYPGVGKIGDLDISIPSMTAPACLMLEIEVKGKNYKVANDWKFWIFPKPSIKNTTAGKRVVTNILWLKDLGYGVDLLAGRMIPAADLFISDRLGPEELNYLENGGTILLLQDHTKPGFSRTTAFYRHRMYHPRLGYSMGVAVHDHPALGAFPHEGFDDLQFFQLMNKSDRFMLDDLPGRVRPILEYVPALEQNQASNTGQLVELKLGGGRVFACGLNLNLATENECTASWLLNQLIAYCLSDQFRPAYRCSRVDFETYMKKAAERVWVPYPAFVHSTLPAGGRISAWACNVADDLEHSDEFGYHRYQMAVDGYSSSYWEPAALPADIGVEWDRPMKISEVSLDFVDNLSLPDDDGWEFQIQQDAPWKKLDINCQKSDATHWKLNVGGVSTQRFRIFFTKMNSANAEAVARGAYAGSARAGYPFPMTRLLEKAVPRVRELKITLAEN